jgi:predicted amidophosphoribosyltransferase
MPTVRELAALYDNVMVPPRLGPGVCRTCFTFTDGYDQCYACSTTQPWLDAMAAISYSVAGEQLHHALAGYKRLPRQVARRLTIQLAAVLWRHLEDHETCLAARTGIARFDVVTTVPSGLKQRDDRHALRELVGTICGPTKERYQRLLERTDAQAGEHDFDGRKYAALARLRGQTVLLVDDTWTTGASAQSAACALKRAGAGPVAALVIGRHLKRDWRENDARLRRLPQPFDPDTCVHCGLPASLASSPQWQRQ